MNKLKRVWNRWIQDDRSTWMFALVITLVVFGFVMAVAYKPLWVGVPIVAVVCFKMVKETVQSIKKAWCEHDE